MLELDSNAEFRIMIVEDEAITAIMLEAQLPCHGYQVFETVPSGAQAITQAELLHPDLVLMDIRLSGPIDGIEAARQIMARSDTQVIFLTGYSNDSIMQQALALKPAGYLVKPVMFEEIAAAIEKVRLQRMPTHPLSLDKRKTDNPNDPRPRTSNL